MRRVGVGARTRWAEIGFFRGDFAPPSGQTNIETRVKEHGFVVLGGYPMTCESFVKIVKRIAEIVSLP